MELPENPSARPDVESEGEEEVEVPLAGVLERFLAYSIDVLLFLFLCYLTLRLAVRSGLVGWSPGVHRGWMLGWTGLYVLYHAFLNAGGRVPLGKRLVGLQVLTADGEPLTLARSLLRAVGYLASAIPLQLGFAWALLDSQKRTWHDLLARTLVIESREKTPRGRAMAALLGLSLLLLCLGLTLRSLFPGLGGGGAEVALAREGLRYVADLEEEFKRQNGRYTEDVRELVRVSGLSVSDFQQTLLTRIHPEGFGLKATKDSYLIVGRARDERGTEVALRGPPK